MKSVFSISYQLNNLPLLLLPAPNTSSSKSGFSRKMWHCSLGSFVVLEILPKHPFLRSTVEGIFKFSYLYLIFWWASLCTLLNFRMFGIWPFGPISS